MYLCKELNREFDTKEAKFKAVIKNKKAIIAQKKAILKKADGVSVANSLSNGIPMLTKANEPVIGDISVLKVQAVINTTNVMDSHGDVHFPGIWKKSLQENKTIMHLQEHQMQFDKIIADGVDLNAYAQTFSWKELGYEYEGDTQALVFDSTVKAGRNSYMFQQYKEARVNNHSVGMYYVKMELAVNSTEDYAEDEKAVWDKYIDKVANKDRAEVEGMFWAITEAKVVEGSAVPIGSNHITPTLNNNKNIEAVSNNTLKTEPSNDTQQDTFTNILKQINF